MEETMIECPICGAEMTMPGDTVAGELVTCAECGSDLEVTCVDPLTVVEAPQEEEDWGQ